MKKSPAIATNAAPGSLLSQYNLLRAVIDAPWATKLDIKIASHVIDNHYAKYGNARASLRYLERATGATRTNIIASLSRVVDQGVFSIARKGIGNRPTEYGVNFDFPNKINIIANCNNPFAKTNNPRECSASGTGDDPSSDASGIADDTSTNGASGIVRDTSTRGIVHDTFCGIAGDTSSGSRGIVDDTESYLRNLPTGRLTVSRTETHATASPPPVGGLEATTAGVAWDPEKAVDPFEELWTVWPRKHQRHKARAAYKALKPSPELHAELLERAAVWAAHYNAAATDKKWWKHLYTWLEGECWLEDLPVPYENAKDAAVARKRENGPREGKLQPEAKEIGLSSGYPIGRHKVKIVGSGIDKNGPEQRMRFLFRIEDGECRGTEFSHAFKIDSADADMQLAGTAIFGQLRKATGVLEPQDTSDFHDLPFLAIISKMGRIEYAAL